MSNGKKKRKLRQLKLDGSSKRVRPPYAGMFKKAERQRRTSLGHRVDSKAEMKIAKWLIENEKAFRTHGALKSDEGVCVTHEELKKIVVSEAKKHGKSQEEIGLLLKRFDLVSAFENVSRYDFRVTGSQRREYYIEYWGLCNPKLEINEKNLRRNYPRKMIEYTFVKKPLKEHLYERSNLKLISLYRKDLKKLDEKLRPVKELEQPGLLTRWFG
jgi:hypothetical protein